MEAAHTIQDLPASADLPFPHVNQFWLIERCVTDHTADPVSAVAALGVTSLTAQRAGLASLVRRHWGFESLHWLRDTVDREDNSTARTGSGPCVMDRRCRGLDPAPAERGGLGHCGDDLPPRRPLLSV